MRRLKELIKKLRRNGDGYRSLTFAEIKVCQPAVLDKLTFGKRLPG